MSVVSEQSEFPRLRSRDGHGASPCGSSKDFLSGGGAMGALIRETDWSRTPIGPIEQWSLSLRMMVSFLLANRFPLLLWWGPQYISIYNEAYRPILGEKHPQSMGQPVSECWSEIWHVIGPLIDAPFHGGPATWMDDLPLELNRHGFLEETHFTVAYSPVPDDSVPNGIGGVLATVHEITEKIVGQRRITALRDLGARTSQAKNVDEACSMAMTALEPHAKDVSFALIYLIEESAKAARLQCATGIELGVPAAPAEIALDEHSDQPWPLLAALQRGGLVIVENLGQRFSSLPPGPWSDPPETAVIVPIKSSAAHQLVGFLVAAASSRLRLDEQYQSFFDLAGSQIATAIASARAYEEERRRAEALAAIDRAKTLFLSNVSHEFRTPLTLMLGPLRDALESADLPVHQRERLDIAHRNSQRLLKLVNSLLDFSRIEEGRAQVSYQATDLSTFTAELASNFRAACERAGLKLVVDCCLLSEPVYVDRDMWEKIVLNLLSNAFKFTFEGEIAVCLRPMDGNVELIVRDSGVGIPQAELPRIFERFHRIQEQRSRTFEGSGIGLALVQELVKLHGGAIRATSVVNRGTTFMVTIPLGSNHLPQHRVGGERELSTSHRAEAFVEEALRWLPDAVASTEPALASDAPGPVSQERMRVLVADDNADLRSYVRRLLEPYYAVQTVSDGRAALQAIRTRRPDLLLADVMMPVVDGFKLLQTIRGDPKLHSLPVIMLSARAGEESRVEGLDHGADEYLVKPFSARELIARVSASLTMSASRERDHARQLGARHILEMVATGISLQQILDALMLFIESQEPGMIAGILLTDDGIHFRPGSGPNIPPAYRQALHDAIQTVPTTPPYFATCAESTHCNKVTRVPDVSRDTRYAREWSDLMLASGLRAVRSTPIRGSDGGPLGCLALYFRAPRDPDPAAPELVDIATHLAAIAIERDRVNAALHSELATMQQLHALSERLAEYADEPAAIVREVLSAAATLVGAEKCSAQVRDKDGTLSLVAAIGFDDDFVDRFHSITENDFTPCAAALRHARRIIAEDLGSNPEFGAFAGLAEAYGVRAAMSIPLLGAGSYPLGVLTTYWGHKHHPSERELRVLDLYAEQAVRQLERVQAATRISRSEKTLSDLIERAPFGVYIVDAQFRILRMNEGSKAGAFRNVHPVIGRPFDDAMRILWPEHVADQIAATFRHTLETGEPYYSVDFTNPRNDIEAVESYEWELHRLLLADGDYCVVCYYYDSTRLRLAEQMVRHRAEQFETLLNRAPLGVYVVDADFRVRDVNPIARPVFGDIPDLIGRCFDDVVHLLWPKPYADEIVQRFRHTLETGEPFETAERIEERLDRGVREYYEWRINRIQLPDGRFGVVCYFRDVSEQVRARQRLKLLVDELNHRAKNTLATVQSIAAQTLRNAKTTAAGHQTLEARLLALANAHDVLTRGHWESASLHEVVSGAMSAYSTEGLETRVQIEGPNVQLLPKAALALAMALHELATNAVKYGALSTPGGRITLNWHISQENPERFDLRWVESGGPPVSAPRSRGFGSRLIERGLKQDLSADIKLTFARSGLVCTILAPLDEIRADERSTQST